MGEALLSASREIGVAVNEFSRTPVGMITTGIIVYKIVGKDILKILFGTLWLVFWGITSRYLYKAAYHYETENVTVPVLWGLWSYTKEVQTGKYTHSSTGEYLFLSIVVSVFSLFAAAITMF